MLHQTQEEMKNHENQYQLPYLGDDCVESSSGPWPSWPFLPSPQLNTVPLSKVVSHSIVTSLSSIHLQQRGMWLCMNALAFLCGYTYATIVCSSGKPIGQCCVHLPEWWFFNLLHIQKWYITTYLNSDKICVVLIYCNYIAIYVTKVIWTLTCKCQWVSETSSNVTNFRVRKYLKYKHTTIIQQGELV